MKNHYTTLCIEEGASQEAVKAAYSKLSKELNPANNDNQEFFKEEYAKVQAAYKALYSTSILATEQGARNKKTVAKLEDKPPVSIPNLAKSKKNKTYLSALVVVVLVGLVFFYAYNQPEKYKSDQITITDNLIYLKHDMSLLSGKVKDALMAGLVLEGKREGVWREWHPNGQLKKECTYSNGEQEGLYRSWWSNGQLGTEANHKDGKLNGIHRKWYKDGRRELEIKKVDDKISWYRYWKKTGGLYNSEISYIAMLNDINDIHVISLKLLIWYHDSDND